jgi:hypothetical protein
MCTKITVEDCNTHCSLLCPIFVFKPYEHVAAYTYYAVWYNNFIYNRVNFYLLVKNYFLIRVWYVTPCSSVDANGMTSVQNFMKIL